jgi:hypothetical protein
MKKQKQQKQAIEGIDNPEQIAGGAIPPRNIKIVPPENGLPLVPQSEL